MAKQPRLLNGKIAAITGGARGIGRATAQALIRQGMKVALGDVDGESVARTAGELGAGTIGLELDVTDRASFERFLDQVERDLGPVDVLINNAGIMQIGRFLDEDDATAHRMIDINLHGVILGMKVGLPRMQARNRGHVINIASQAGKIGLPGGATYCATKHAVVGISEAVRAELRDTDIDVSYVMPAIVNTELGSGLVETRGVKKLQPEDVAEAIVEALQYGIVDVWVPKSTKFINRGTQLIPRRAAEAVARLLKADQALAGADAVARHGYDERARRSAPGPATQAQAPGEPAPAGADEQEAAPAPDSAGEREREPV